MNAVDDGIVSGNLTFADIMFLVAFIVFLVGAYLASNAKALWATAIAVGLACVSLGWLVL
jgi:positive regulator of sigma E activity